jgi:hypothetical protein
MLMLGDMSGMLPDYKESDYSSSALSSSSSASSVSSSVNGGGAEEREEEAEIEVSLHCASVHIPVLPRC